MLQRLLLSLLIAIPASLLAISAAAVNADSEHVYYPVRLNPDANPNESAIMAEVNADKKCKSNTHDGCMLFTAKTVGVINFYLKGPPNKTQCSEVNKESAKYVITKIELSTTPMPNDYTKGKFGENEVLEDWLKEDAFEDVKPNGVIYDKSRETGQTNVLLFNKNSHEDEDEEGQVNSFWYRVTITDCDDPNETQIFDPRGDNEGLN